MLNVNASSFSFTPMPVRSQLKPTSDKHEKYQIRKEVKARKKAQDKYDTKFKTELCKSFCENGWCRYGEHCKFAHGTEDLAPEEIVKRKEKNCKVFFASGYCPYGVRC